MQNISFSASSLSSLLDDTTISSDLQPIFGICVSRERLQNLHLLPRMTSSVEALNSFSLKDSSAHCKDSDARDSHRYKQHTPDLQSDIFLSDSMSSVLMMDDALFSTGGGLSDSEWTSSRRSNSGASSPRGYSSSSFREFPTVSRERSYSHSLENSSHPNSQPHSPQHPRSRASSSAHGTSGRLSPVHAVSSNRSRFGLRSGVSHPGHHHSLSSSRVSSAFSTVHSRSGTPGSHGYGRNELSPQLFSSGLSLDGDGISMNLCVSYSSECTTLPLPDLNTVFSCTSSQSSSAMHVSDPKDTKTIPSAACLFHFEVEPVQQSATGISTLALMLGVG